MASSATIETKPMSLEEVKKTRAWSALTLKQRVWVSKVVETNGDFFLATKAAYNSKSDLNAQILSHEVRKNPRVAAVLDLFYGRTERDERKEFFDAIQRKIKKGTLTIAEVEGIKLLCREKNWVEPENLPPGKNGYVPVSQHSKKYKIGDIVLVNNKPTRVTKLDQDHQPIEGDPL